MITIQRESFVSGLRPGLTEDVVRLAAFSAWGQTWGEIYQSCSSHAGNDAGNWTDEKQGSRGTRHNSLLL